MSHAEQKWEKLTRRVLRTVLNVDKQGKIALFCAMGPDYAVHFGETPFYRAWQHVVQHSDVGADLKYSLIQIDMSPNTEYVIDVDDVSNSEPTSIKSNVHLDYFYVLPYMEMWDPVRKELVDLDNPSKDAVYLSQLWNMRERAFFKGLGFGMLCKTFDALTKLGEITDDNVVTLEASGEYEEKSMHGLVHYYEKLSFIIGPEWWRQNHPENQKEWSGSRTLQWLRNAIQNMWVPMVTTVGQIREKCNLFGRTVDPKEIEWAVVKVNIIHTRDQCAKKMSKESKQHQRDSRFVLSH